MTTTTEARPDASGAGWYAYGALTTLLRDAEDWSRAEDILGLIVRVVEDMETRYGVVSR